ncbi:hypothetical protein D3C75_533680 [compost metagenome]
MHQAEHNDCKPCYYCIRINDIEESGIHLHVAVNRQPFDEAREDHCQQERRQEAAEEDADIPGFFPDLRIAFASEFKGDTAGDQRQQSEYKRNIESAEQCCIPVREGGEHGSGSRQQPYFIRIPERADRVNQQPAFCIIFSQNLSFHADAEVKALKEEEPDKQNRNQHKP